MIRLARSLAGLLTAAALAGPAQAQTMTQNGGQGMAQGAPQTPSTPTVPSTPTAPPAATPAPTPAEPPPLQASRRRPLR